MIFKESTAGWLELQGTPYFFRSQWERNYARYLQFLKESKQITHWSYEPKTFWFEGIKRGCVSYKPDFQIFNNDGTHHWVEVKGYYDPKSLTKIKRFKKYYPDQKLILIDSKWFSANSKKLKLIIPNWE